MWLTLCLLAACGGGSSDGESDNGNPGSESSGDGGAAGELVESSPGSEPRTTLRITTPARTRLRVTTTSEQVVTAAGRTEELTTGSTMALDARLEEIGEDYRIIVLPELEAFEPAGSGYDGLALFRTQDTVNDRGEQRRFAPRRDIHDVLTLDAFSLPTLTLSVPDSMVGPGAVWTQTSRLPLVAVTTRTTVDAIDDTSVTVSKRITVGSDPEQRYAVTGRMSAVYSRDALLLRSADIELTLRFEDAVYINGRRERVVDDRTFRQALREISP